MYQQYKLSQFTQIWQKGQGLSRCEHKLSPRKRYAIFIQRQWQSIMFSCELFHACIFLFHGEKHFYSCDCCLAIYEILFIWQKILNQCLIIYRLNENIVNTCLYCLGRIWFFFPSFLLFFLLKIMSVPDLINNTD